MRLCILCGNETEGSTGAAGIRWTTICQQCKDDEDAELEERCKRVASRPADELPEREFYCGDSPDF